MTPSIVRLGQRDEMADLVALMREGSQEQDLFPVDEARARDMLNRAFNREGGITAVIGPKGAIEAAMYLSLALPLYSAVWHLEETFVVVRKAFRRSTHAKALLGFAKKCSDELSVPLLIGVLSNERTEAKVRLYRRQFGRPVGGFFLYNVPRWDLEDVKG
jgi:hypothetical protein